MKATALLLALLAGDLDLTNLWVDVPAKVTEVSLRSADNKPLTWKDLARRVTVVGFYSSFRGDDGAAAGLDELLRDLEPGQRRDAAVYLVSIDLPKTEEERASVRALVSALKVKVPLLIDDQLMLFKWVNGQLKDPQRPLASNEMISLPFVLIVDGKVVRIEPPAERSAAAVRAARKAAVLKALRR